MKILITTGIFPPDVGGPAIYAKSLAEELKERNHKVEVLKYEKEKKMPPGIRHFWFFIRVLSKIKKTDFIIALDNFSVGLPSVSAARLAGKKVILRIGGDFLWESYVEKTGNLISLTDFYKKMPKLPLKQKIIYKLTRFLLTNANALAFNTNWQKEIFIENYNLNKEKCFVVENYFENKAQSGQPEEKNYLWAGRNIKLKNLEILKLAFAEAQKENPHIKLDLVTNLTQDKLLEKIKKCHAVILPSISDISPNFIMDALSFGKPFILTKYSGLFEKLKSVGIFVDPFDKNDIKEKIIFLADKNNYDEYRKRENNFSFSHSWQKITDEYLEIYKRI